MEKEIGLFSQSHKALSHTPLAHRMRPKTLDEFFGQDQILGKDQPLRKLIEMDRFFSIIFWGPPGCGKTTLATIIAQHTHSRFESVSAVVGGVKELKEVIERARNDLIFSNRKTILFIDEIHRFNRTQQDVLLPAVEQGEVILIGATTENPSFEINSALLSRLRVIRLNPLDPQAIEKLIRHALNDSEKGLGGLLKLSDEVITWLSMTSQGDARRVLTTLEFLNLKYSLLSATKEPLSLKEVQEVLEKQIGRSVVSYDKSGEEHYNVISAFIKSIRDSDPHAGLYYLARMLEGGEDPLFIARRMVVLASEDIGNADPRALQIAIAVKEAVEFIGLPEARISLAQGVTYLASAPKSNASYKGIEKALEDVKELGALQVPFHLRNAVTSLMKNEGYGKNYRYAHDDPEKRARQTHLPKEILGRRYYFPENSGLEKTIKERLDLLNLDFDSKS